jgi:hypothetical protein
MKKSIDTIWNRTCDLAVCSAVPQSTAPPQFKFMPKNKLKRIWWNAVVACVMIIHRHVSGATKK